MRARSYLLYFLLVTFIQKNLTQLNYLEWLQQIDDQILKVPSEPEERFLQVPLDIEIITDSANEQCVEANTPYCHTQSSTQAPVDAPNSDCGGSHPELCSDVTCSSETTESPLKEYETSVAFTTPALYGANSIGSKLECGLTVNPNSLYFGEPVVITDRPPSNCSLVPSIVVNVTSNDQNATISFKVRSQVVRAKFLTITGFNGNLLTVFSTEISIDESVVKSNTVPYVSDPKVMTYGEVVMGDFTIVVFTTGFGVFSNGEIAFTVETVSNLPDLTHISVEFGSKDFRGSVTDITMYSVVANTNEIYSMYSGEPLAKDVFRPECLCPRAYMDSFSLMGALASPTGYVYPYICYDGVSNSYLSHQRRYKGFNKGKWDVFAPSGWQSDFTSRAKITLKLPQPMLIYMVSFGISDTYGDKMPKSMQLKVVGGLTKTPTTVYVSKNCEEEYKLSRTRLADFSNEEISPVSLNSRKRRDLNEVSAKCYNIDDVTKYYYQCPRKERTNVHFDIPILSPDEVNYPLDDAFVGDVIIELFGHDGGVSEQRTDWYFVSNLYIATRPHCGGYNYTLVGAPTTMSEYYNFHKPNAKAYTCQCPQGITGDMCESCVELPDIYRYMKEPGVCADCRCSDLTRKDQQQCDENTGQCNCVGNVDLDLAGRQCHWYVSDVTPLYGPIAGGTRVIIEGGFFYGFGISFSVLLDNSLNVSLNGNQRSGNLEFSTSPFHTPNTTVNLVVTASTALDIGPQSKFFQFEYKPNPVLEDIQPRSTILSGGKILTVSGKFFDSVYTPEMIIYLRLAETIMKTFVTTCKVMSSTMMYCPTANMSVEVVGLLEGELPTNSTGEIQDPSGVSTFPPTANSSMISIKTLDNDSLPVETSRRRRSSSDSGENAVNGNNEIDFTLGFVYDGHKDYADLEQSSDPELRDISRLYVYDDPEVFRFQDQLGQFIMEYSPMQPTISIKGDRMDYGVSAGDYTIEIGVEYCTVIDLTSNEVICRPPAEQPQAEEYSYVKYKKRKIPHVKVLVGNIKISVGHVYYITDIWTYNTAFRVSMIVLIAVLSLVTVFVVVCLLVRRSRQQMVVTGQYRRSAEEEGSVQLWFGGQSPDANIQANVDRCRIPQKRLRTGKKLGEGRFGFVYKGQLITPAGNLRTVAVKSLKDSKVTYFEDVEKFLAEGTLSIDFKHENILSLVGVVAEEGERPLVVLPYMENGDLHTFISECDLDIVLADILHFGLQIANGMSYLAKERFVHRDLAARNCMVDESYIVKISGFTMCRDVYEKDYYTNNIENKQQLIKWLAWESLTEGIHTTKSDVWSFGITMCELFNRGCRPYPAIPNSSMRDWLRKGNRPFRPHVCAPIIYEMMRKCWEEDPDNRPTFDEISDFISKLLRGETIPTVGSDEAYSYSRKLTQKVSDNYQDESSTSDDDNYIKAHASPN